jgi:hypothetical protein
VAGETPAESRGGGATSRRAGRAYEPGPPTSQRGEAGGRFVSSRVWNSPIPGVCLERWETGSNMSRRRRRPTQEGSSSDRTARQSAHPNLASEEIIARQREALDRLVQSAERSFHDKQAASARRDWCNPIPAERKVETVQAFLKAFHDERTMEIATCTVCYVKKKARDLGHVD